MYWLKLKDKKGFEASFAWMFAIFVGALVLFLGIYAASNLIGSARFESDTKVAAQLGILLNPVETNLESGRFAVIEFPEETRVYNNCREEGNFGAQGIRTSIRSEIGKDFERPGAETVFFNKYLFSEKIEQGRNLYLFVKPFEFPYKVADLIIASSENFCFVTPPSEIKDEIEDLRIDNINLVSNVGECEIGEKKVCFGIIGCDVDVDIQRKIVSKDGIILEFEGSLIYGAIFADPDVYECQVKRLMKRTGELAQLYVAKTEFLSSQGCSSNLGNDLLDFAKQTQGIKLKGLVFDMEDIRRKNELLSCQLF
jgi:hypothetical protein